MKNEIIKNKYNSYYSLGDNVNENITKELTEFTLPNKYVFNGVTVNIEREFKTKGKSCIDLLIELFENKNNKY